MDKPEKSTALVLGAAAAVLIAAGLLYVLRPEPITKNAGADNVAAAVGSVAYYGNTTGYLALPQKTAGGPAGAEKYPAIILIHEWWGLNDDMKSLADRYARDGYAAIAVDLYGGRKAATASEAQALAGEVRGNTEEAFRNLRAAVEYLRAREDVDGERLASVGWCFGGGWSYQMAVNDLGTKASIMYYGQFDPEDDFEHMRASILGHFGGEDSSIQVDTVREFQARLATASGAHEVYVYPNAGHGFANERGGENTAYNEDAAELAWQRTTAFLSRVLAATN